MTTNNTLAEDLTEAMQRCEQAYHQMFVSDTPGNGKAFDAARAEFARLVAQVGQPAMPALAKELERTRNGARILERALEDARTEIDRLKAAAVPAMPAEAFDKELHRLLNLFARAACYGTNQERIDYGDAIKAHASRRIEGE